jgi:hypothetical protein
VENAEPMAYGVMGMSVEQFESMTPYDFLVAVRGFQWKLERDHKDRASALISIINTCGHLKKGKRVKMQDLHTPSLIDPRNPFYQNYVGIGM